MFGLPGLVQGYTVASNLILGSEQVLGVIPAVIKSVFRRDPGILKLGEERLAKLPRPILSLFTGYKGHCAVILGGHTPRAIHNERRRRFGKCHDGRLSSAATRGSTNIGKQTPYGSTACSFTSFGRWVARDPLSRQKPMY